MNQHPNHSSLRRFGVATALGSLLGAGGLFTLLGAGSAQAEGDIEPPDRSNRIRLGRPDRLARGPVWRRRADL